MLRTRRESWRWLVLGLAMVVVALVMVALACGPSAPSGQAGGGAEARPTPTPTPTPEATATATPTPTPTADADSLSPEVNAVLALHAAAQGASGSSQSGPALPEKINLYISTKRNYNQPIQKFLKDNGATVIEGKEGPSGQHYLSKIEAIVPVSLIPALSRQPGFGFAFTDYARYDKLEYELSNLVMQYESGAITAEKAAARTSARSGDSGELVHIDVFYESCASIPGIVSFIKAETGLTPWWYAADEKCYGAGDYPFVDNVIPFSSLVRLSQQPGVQRIKPIVRDPQSSKISRPALASDDDSVAQCVQLAEELGYESAWVAEGHGGDQFSILTACALETSRIRLGTSISSVYVRSAPTIAMAAACVDHYSQGRFILGLGSSHKVQVGPEHGLEFSAPIPRVRDTVDIVRRLLRDGNLTDYRGEVTNIQSFDLHFPVFRPELPIYLAAVFPKMLEIAGEISQGILLTWCTPEHARTAAHHVAAGAERAGVAPESVELATLLSVSANGAGDGGMRRVAATYAGRFPRYRRLMAEAGLCRRSGASATRVAGGQRRRG